MISHRIVEDLGVIIMEARGDISFTEFREAIDAISADPVFSPSYPGVTDLRQMGHGLDPDEAELLARYVTEHQLTHGHWAILATSPSSTAVSLFYEETAAVQHRVKIFSTVAAASSFLGIDLSQQLAE